MFYSIKSVNSLNKDFLFQAKTGHFLETGNWSTDSKINEVVFSPRELSQISKKSLWVILSCYLYTNSIIFFIFIYLKI